MSEMAAPAERVVLILPQATLDEAALQRLADTLRPAVAGTRVLLCLLNAAQPELIAALEGVGIQTEILVARTAPLPSSTKAFILHALPGIKQEDLTEFALALSDMVLVDTVSRSAPLEKLAQALGKPVVAYGGTLPALPKIEPVSPYLAPEGKRWPSCLRGVAGRLEQALIEVFGLNLPKAWQRAAKPDLDAYFAKRGWEQVTPDKAAVGGGSPIEPAFAAMDRGARLGSYIHRDIGWLTHFFAAFAVLAAVAGHITYGHHHYTQSTVWGVAELVALVIVAGLVIGMRRSQLQDRWAGCRMGAEQLRIARMSLPLLVLPRALATTDQPAKQTGHHKGQGELEFDFVALMEVKRAVRAHGLPRLEPSLSAKGAIAWLRLIVNDQIDYHAGNHAKLERAENGVRWSTTALFVVALVAVILHFRFHNAWLLLGTAAGPAFAAALHGVSMRLGIVHRAALSQGMEIDLRKVDADLAEAEAALSPLGPTEEDWAGIRRLAYRATESMGAENTSWHGLVRRYRDELV